MMVTLTQKLLRALFRALDLVEEARSAWGRMRGEPVPPPPWEPAGGPVGRPPAPAEDEPARALHDDDDDDDTPDADVEKPRRPPRKGSRPPATGRAPGARASNGGTRGARGAAGPRARPVREGRKPTPQPVTGSAPPPSADGPAFDVLLDAISGGTAPAITEELAVDGKTMPARILWALASAEKLLGRGLTGPEMSQALEKAGIPTAPNNLMRTVRQDAGTLFERNPGDGRAVILTLTAAGREQARALGVLG